MTKISSEYQEILKLKDILENNLSTSEDYLKKCIESTIPNCRRLAFLIIKNKQEYAKLLIKDPYNKIRALAICYCTNIDILLELLSDQNDCIRVEVLKRLNDLKMLILTNFCLLNYHI
ncbi:hypothetical protein A0H76_2646 [Hepatospora eriocheir]|uniref:Uncharacterized protein n=1 Tax=Hepatospora eriocheir TaxID=1081669 RepID=A0A1X0QFC9_9MICR|nr:hypothetical protein A0H76_2646 [Hepatospora eriocheir]